MSDRNEQIDKIWDIIEKAIIRSGESSLPNKSVRTPKKQLVPNRKKHRFKAYMSLARLINKIRKAEHGVQSLLVGKWNQRLKIINRQAECNISMIELNSLQSWIESAILWWKVIGNRISEESQKLKEKEIKNYIKKRSEMIIKEQRLMLASLLEKPFNKVRLDRVLVKEDLEYRLAVAPSEVLLDTKDHFKGQFRGRCPKIDCMTEDWKAVYSPLNEVQENWYDSTLDLVDLEEWQSMLKEVKAESAAGISNIVYLTLSIP